MHQHCERGEQSMRRYEQGQVTAEMAVLYTFVIAGLVFMGVYLQRGTQGGLKSNADGIGTQFSTEGGWKSYSAQDSHEEAGVSKSVSCSQSHHAVALTGNPLAATANCSGAPAGSANSLTSSNFASNP